jgi:hypothetical protein
MRALAVSAPREIQAFCAGEELWLANLTGDRRRVKLAHRLSGSAATLDAESFVAAAEHPDALNRLARPYAGDQIDLDAYAVVRVRFA